MSLPTLASFVGSSYLERRLRRLGKQLLRCNDSGSNSIRHLHAFGHSHLAWDAIINNVRYVHVPLAYPREWKERSKSLEIGSMKGDGKAIGSSITTTVTKGGRNNNNDRIPVCIWERRHPAATANTKLNDSAAAAAAAAAVTSSNNEDGGSGFPPMWLGGWWSKYYSIMERQPQRNNELASWVAQRYKQLPGGKIVDFDHITIEKKHLSSTTFVDHRESNQ